MSHFPLCFVPLFFRPHFDPRYFDKRWKAASGKKRDVDVAVKLVVLFPFEIIIIYKKKKKKTRRRFEYSLSLSCRFIIETYFRRCSSDTHAITVCIYVQIFAFMSHKCEKMMADLGLADINIWKCLFLFVTIAVWKKKEKKKKRWQNTRV